MFSSQSDSAMSQGPHVHKFTEALNQIKDTVAKLNGDDEHLKGQLKDENTLDNLKRSWCANGIDHKITRSSAQLAETHHGNGASPPEFHISTLYPAIG